MATSDILGPVEHSALDWQAAYQLVLTETDRLALFKYVEVAESKLLMRRETLRDCEDCSAERQSVEDALAYLQQVKKSKLNFGR
jgi:hypothetical protein